MIEHERKQINYDISMIGHTNLSRAADRFFRPPRLCLWFFVVWLARCRGGGARTFGEGGSKNILW